MIRLKPAFDLFRQTLATLKHLLLARFRGYGLEGLDFRLLESIQPDELKRPGFFVELGANNGLAQANTYLLQQRYGWTGLLIEPSPSKYIECVRNRSFGNRPSFRCAACVDFDYDQPFIAMQYADLMSVALHLDVSSEQASAHAERGHSFLMQRDEAHVFGAVARTLTSLLDEVAAPEKFDLLSLDVEGNELCVLRGLDFSRYRPHWILVEVRTVDVSDYLHARGYRLSAVLSDAGSYRDLLFEAS
ncbi:FkbM family methyltransferase [Microcystis elabens FACHB-917]|nr:FkbM family methyltransferase [Microcystis elabens FACHB-917]